MPEYKVIITPDAESDLEDIGDYIAFELHVPEMAVRYLRDIREEISFFS